MKLEEFVKRLYDVRPNEDLFKKVHKERSYEAVLKDYVLTEKTIDESTDYFLDKTGIIGELIQKYDVTSLHFFNFSFFNRIVEAGDYYLFALEGGVYLAFQHYTSKISVIDAYAGNDWIDDVSPNADAFLNTLIIAQEMYTDRRLKITSGDEAEDRKKYIERCVIENGERYRTFYESFIW